LVGIDNDRFCSASRDTTVRIWTRVDGHFIQTGVFTKHSHFVNALALTPDGLVVSAGNDKTIFTFDPSNPDQFVYKLEGHSDNVCALGVSKEGAIVSGSWDKTARVWIDGKCVYVLKGHEFAVWGVLWIGKDVLTGDLCLCSVC
jgi:phospholipase A-2-activating protein